MPRSISEELRRLVANRNDWWFHVRGMPGSHVILQVPRGETPDRQTLKQAAALAAYHSKARQAGVVAVSCTRARYVTKPRDAKVGAVQIRRDMVFNVRPALGEAAIEPASDPAAEQ
jgi:predicted ribosome quality control (RQC) complex YloA/Tae2 family protein